MPLLAGAADLLAAPTLAPTVVQSAFGSSGAITYQIVSCNYAGSDSIPGPGFTTPANNAATPSNALTWVAVPGAFAYRIIKNSTLLATVSAGTTTYTDATNGNGSSYTFATVNPPAFVPVVNSPIDGQKATYAAAMQGLVAVTGCTDLFTIYGSASKTVRITRVQVVGTTITTPIQSEIQLIKRSAVNTTGTSSAPTNIFPYDSTSPAATATVLGYTANPGGLGAVVGILDASKIILNIAPTSTLDVAPDRYIREFGGARPTQAVVLRGVAQGLAVNLVGTAFATAATFDVSWEWTED